MKTITGDIAIGESELTGEIIFNDKLISGDIVFNDTLLEDDLTTQFPAGVVAEGIFDSTFDSSFN